MYTCALNLLAKCLLNCILFYILFYVNSVTVRRY